MAYDLRRPSDTGKTGVMINWRADAPRSGSLFQRRDCGSVIARFEQIASSPGPLLGTIVVGSNANGSGYDGA